MRKIAALMLLLAALCGAVSAQNSPAVGPADTRAVRTLIQMQLDAFAQDDAAKAFSYAAPAIQKMFGTPGQFLAMVRAQYPMVHRPAAVAFLQPQADGDAVLQRVQITDIAGKEWAVSYLVSRQADRSWRIGACVVAPAKKRLST